MRHLAYTVIYFVVPTDTSLLTTTLYSSVGTLVYNVTNYSVPYMCRSVCVYTHIHTQTEETRQYLFPRPLNRPTRPASSTHFPRYSTLHN